MSEPAHRKATYEDVLAAPRHMVAEIIAGELRLQPRPAKPHTAAATRSGRSSGYRSSAGAMVRAAAADGDASASRC
jgi:hypothetical protein